MWKLLILATLVASAYSGEDFFKESGDQVYADHLRYTTESLHLTTGELKVFAGHAMNMLKSKCPAVDAGKIFKVQKYFGKLLAKKDLVQGNSKDFKPVLQSLITCAKDGASKPRPDPISTENFSFHPIPSVFRLPFFGRLFSKPKPAAGMEEGSMATSTPAVVTNAESALSKSAPEPVKPEESESTQPASLQPHRVFTTTIFVRPEDMQEGIRTSGGFANWIRNLFTKVHGLFSDISPFSRKKRDVSLAPEIVQKRAMDQTPMIDIMNAFPEIIPIKQDEVKVSKGKKAFGALVNQWCRIYCDKCNGEKEIAKFKMAAKQLLTTLFEEDSGLDVAAKHYLDDGFLNSIDQCGSEHEEKK